MKADLETNFEQFVAAFVHAYWSTIKNGDFPMPPDEPVDESLEELLSSVSFTIESGNGLDHKFRMTGEAGDWWRFGFYCQNENWKLVRASARSEKKHSPHDLLDQVYAPHFRPFLEHVTDQANNSSNPGV